MQLGLKLVGSNLASLSEERMKERVKRWEQRWKTMGVFCTQSIKNSKLSPEELECSENEVCGRAVQILKPYLTKGVKVLDVGMGPGNFAKLLLPEMDKHGGGVYTGVDFCLPIIATAEEALTLLPLSPWTKITLRHAHMAQLTWGANPVGIESKDIEVAGRSLIHIIDDEEFEYVIQEICHALKPGGRLLIYGPESDGLNMEYVGDTFRKNEDTMIRSSRVYKRVLISHGITEILDAQWSSYVFDEIFTFRLFQKASDHAYLHQR